MNFRSGVKVRTFFLLTNLQHLKCHHFKNSKIFESKARAPCDVHSMDTFLDKIQIAGLNLGYIFNSRSGCMCAIHILCNETELPNLKLKTQSKEFLGYLPLAFVRTSRFLGLTTNTRLCFECSPVTITEMTTEFFCKIDSWQNLYKLKHLKFQWL
jgi:hypothetical protein